MSRELDLLRQLRSEADVAPDAVERVRARLVTLIESRPDERRGAARVVPYLIYDDVERALRWLTRAFGLREIASARLVVGGVVERAEMELDGALVTLGRPSIHGDSPSHGVSSMLEVTVSDVAGHYQRARRAGAVIVIDLEDTPWGMRRYQARDLEGHNWHFAESLDSSP